MENKFVPIIILVFAILIVGGVFFFSNKSISKNQALENGDTSVSISTPTPEASSEENIMEGNVAQLGIEDLVVGAGMEAVSGKKVTVNYSGTLTNGTKFDSSYDRNEPFSFNLGAGEVIKGWDQGVVGMKVGGKRKLTIPSDLAYGDSGIPGAIPGGATLIFEVELLKVE